VSEAVTKFNKIRRASNLRKKASSVHLDVSKFVKKGVLRLDSAQEMCKTARGASKKSVQMNLSRQMSGAQNAAGVSPVKSGRTGKDTSRSTARRGSIAYDKRLSLEMTLEFETMTPRTQIQALKGIQQGFGVLRRDGGGQETSKSFDVVDTSRDDNDAPSARVTMKESVEAANSASDGTSSSTSNGRRLSAAAVAIASLERMSLVQAMRKKYDKSDNGSGPGPAGQPVVPPLKGVPRTDLQAPRAGSPGGDVKIADVNYTSKHFFGAQRKDSVADIERGRVPAPWEIEGKRWHAHMDDVTFVLPLHSDGAVLTVSLDGFHRMWNLDGDCLGESALPNITDTMRQLMLHNKLVNWSLIMEAPLVSGADRQDAEKLLKLYEDERLSAREKQMQREHLLPSVKERQADVQPPPDLHEQSGVDGDADGHIGDGSMVPGAMLEGPSESMPDPLHILSQTQTHTHVHGDQILLDEKNEFRMHMLKSLLDDSAQLDLTPEEHYMKSMAAEALEAAHAGELRKDSSCDAGEGNAMHVSNTQPSMSTRPVTAPVQMGSSLVGISSRRNGGNGLGTVLNPNPSPGASTRDGGPRPASSPADLASRSAKALQGSIHSRSSPMHEQEEVGGASGATVECASPEVEVLNVSSKRFASRRGIESDTRGFDKGVGSDKPSSGLGGEIVGLPSASMYSHEDDINESFDAAHDTVADPSIKITLHDPPKFARGISTRLSSKTLSGKIATESIKGRSQSAGPAGKPPFKPSGSGKNLTLQSPQLPPTTRSQSAKSPANSGKLFSAKAGISKGGANGNNNRGPSPVSPREIEIASARVLEGSDDERDGGGRGGEDGRVEYQPPTWSQSPTQSPTHSPKRVHPARSPTRARPKTAHASRSSVITFEGASAGSGDNMPSPMRQRPSTSSAAFHPTSSTYTTGTAATKGTFTSEAGGRLSGGLEDTFLGGAWNSASLTSSATNQHQPGQSHSRSRPSTGHTRSRPGTGHSQGTTGRRGSFHFGGRPTKGIGSTSALWMSADSVCKHGPMGAYAVPAPFSDSSLKEGLNEGSLSKEDVRRLIKVSISM
jgi:hypothetical protein